MSVATLALPRAHAMGDRMRYRGVIGSEPSAGVRGQAVGDSRQVVVG